MTSACGGVKKETHQIDTRRHRTADAHHDHPDTLDTEESLAELYAPMQPARAETLYREAADGYRRTLGPAHGGTISAVIGLAQFWVEEKKFAQAESLLQQELGALRDDDTGETRCTATR